MDTYEIRYFETPDGLELLRAKRYGDNIVPFGTSFDEGERFDNLTRRVRNDIFPLLRAIQSFTMNLYGIHPGSITYSGYSPYENFDNISLDEFEVFCNDHLIRYSPDYFNIVLNMKIKKGSIFWDAYFLIKMDCIKLQDENVTEDFPVWYLSFGNSEESFCETLDENFSGIMISDIVKWAVGLIQVNYNSTINEDQ
jgi:hypothetical protein